MIEYETVEEALKALCEFNSAKEIQITDMETGKTRQATLEDIQLENMDMIYQLADLLKINLSKVES